MRALRGVVGLACMRVCWISLLAACRFSTVFAVGTKIVFYFYYYGRWRVGFGGGFAYLFR